MYNIVNKIKKLNSEKTGVISITDTIGTMYEVTNVNSEISYIYIKRFNKLIKEGKIIKI